MTERPDGRLVLSGKIEHKDTARPRPCSSCPYRQNVPSGIWGPSEYEKLPEYDRPMALQPAGAFACHQGSGHLCSGWLATHGPENLLSVRIGVGTGHLDPSVLDYSTDVPVFASGAEACEHGKRDMENPSEEAQAQVLKIMQVRGLA